MTRNPCFLRCRLLPVIARAWPFESRGRSARGRSHIPPSQRTPHQGCRAAPKWFGWSCCRKRITATATSPPALHNKLSRLPSTHPASLERHTNGESAQKRDNYHHGFLRIFLPAGNDLVTFECDACAADPAETRLNIRANSCREIARRAD